MLFILGGLSGAFLLFFACPLLFRPDFRSLLFRPDLRSALPLSILAALAATASGYLLLALAAKRGNAAALPVVAIVFVAQMLSIGYCGYLISVCLPH